MSDKTTTSFMRSLCMGRIEQDCLFPFPVLSADQKEMLHEIAGALEGLLGSRTEDFSQWDADGDMPAQFIEELKEFGMFGLIIPEEHGGMGLGNMAYSRTLQEVGRYDASVAVTIGAHSSIGMRGLLLFGTDEQKSRYMPKLASGEMIAAFCLTEPGAGSDAAAIKTTAVRKDGGWVLNGSKLWITNGGFAEFFTVFARTGTGDGQGKMTAFIVTKDMDGVSIGPHEDKMGLRASSTTSVLFDDVHVPGENVLGEEGLGFKAAMQILNSGRTGLGGGSVGGMKHLIELSTRQANERKTFGQPISSYGLIKEKVGQMVVDCYTSEAVVTMVGGLIDEGCEEYAVEAAISKVYATECLARSADEALQIAGGNGFMREYPYERIVRDCRINRIFEGTNEILRLFIALTAMNDVATQLKELSRSMKGVFNDPIKGFGVMSDYARKHAGLRIRRGDIGKMTGLDPSIQPQVDIFEKKTRNLAQAADRILRKHGKNIIGKQFATKRLADIMIDLFVMACTLSRVQASIDANGVEKASREIEILKVFTREARIRIKRNFRRIDNNEDELLKALAVDAFEAERYRWDTI
ncbi:MAG: acyl-CoA dehydrogenase [Xanthomonadales bacterium]|nr:acyl-CoA dehydrogenase family protein [Gammaproteobacteria bacterium]MBT8054317.1 acyl-CoA dehydrogenase family protein [Gammaproteobacteria bacterium]NND57490.1 acyl-CoA dehydrogenase [Xanthomonadales bacterium]NNK51214.1 acyl-CoA dehydrogenase [Xanthomonadales bacterium]